MTRIGHLLDGTAGWEQRLGLSQLMDRLPERRFASIVAAIDPGGRQVLTGAGREVEILTRSRGIELLGAPGTARFVAGRQIDVLHAWGAGAAAAAAAATSKPLVVQLYDPSVAARCVKLLRALARPRGFAVVCSCEIVRRRLVEGGLDPGVAVVIRPGVDFRALHQWRQGSLRASWGLARDDEVAIVPEPVTRGGGQMDAVRAVWLRNYVSHGIKVIVPGRSLEQGRIARFASAVPESNVLIEAAPTKPYEQLLSASDVLLVTPRGDISTTCIALAMAAGVAVIGTAVHAVAELIANKVNGLLFKQTPGRSMTTQIIKALGDHESRRRAVEVARGHAYEAFGLQRCIDQHIRLYENLLGGHPPGEGIVDSAVAG